MQMLRCKYKAVAIPFLAFLSLALTNGCAAGVDINSLSEDDTQGLIQIDDLAYVGAFAIPAETYGTSSANWALGTIEVNGNSLFMAGHNHHDAIAEFTIPPLVNSTNIADLNYSTSPEQAFATVFDRVAGGNPEQLDQIVGMELYNGKLIVNATEYYDAPADNRLSTFVVQESNNLETSSLSPLNSVKGHARAAGWISTIPDNWQTLFGCSHISGSSSGDPIIARLSVGPSAFCFNMDDLTNANKSSTIATRELLGFSLDRPLERDLFNESGNNTLWTHISQARFGFIVPGTRTYATFGTSGGHASGIGYKITQQDGNLCAGYCASDPSDIQNYYWFWDMSELARVHNGKMKASELKPYAHGEFNVPFQAGKNTNPIGGGSYDSASGLLYLSVREANKTLGQFNNPPVIVAYKIR